MKMNEKTTNPGITDIAKAKAAFEPPVIEVITFALDDVITTSSGFGGDDDLILPPDNF